tara:strand:+ start:669 stop:842 length:174 start_codon:yes stop_codon:yes gene_type:complete
MEQQYTINEILSAIDDLQNSKKEVNIEPIEVERPQLKKNSDIPSNTLKLIEEAEKNI